MFTEYWQQILRRPRYQVIQSNGLKAEIRLSSDAGAVPIAAELLNLSRQGFQLRTAEPPGLDEAIVLWLHSEKSPLDAQLPGVVRWQQEEASGEWLLGCQSTEDVQWETMGELFLDGILAMDKPA